LYYFEAYFWPKIYVMLKIFRITAWLEGISFLVLLFIAMPFKYFFEMPILVTIIGMLHGVLFLLYLMMAFLIKNERNWDLKSFSLICLASVLPFGTFYVEKKYLR
jgi:integral membrane protein